MYSSSTDLGLTTECIHALAGLVFAGLVCHLVFNRLEPRTILQFVCLLALVPLLLSRLLVPHTSGILNALVLTFAVYWISLVSSVVLYRVSPLHPLAKYSGPLLCKVSKIWFSAIAMKGKQHVYYLQLHERYGDVVRIGPNELSFRDVDAIFPMMGSRGMPKGPWWDGRVLNSHAVRPLLALRDPEEHARRRRAWNRAFSRSSLVEYKVLVDARITQLLEALEKRSTGEVTDLSKWIGWLTLDIMNDVMFSTGGHAMASQGQDPDDVDRLIIESQPLALLMGHLPWLGKLHLWLPWAGHSLRAFRKYAADRVIERKTRGTQRQDVFSHLIDEAGIESTPPSINQIISDGALAIIAGAETTSTTLCNIIWFILQSPKTYQRLQPEIDDPDAKTSQIGMPYLNAVINEALRLFPAVLSGSQRAPLVGSGGQMVGPHFVPEGTSAVVHTYSLHRDPRYFSPFPDHFIPERWLPSEQQITLEPAIFGGSHEVIHNTAAFIPFSVGPSNCVGRSLAYQEMQLVLCGLFEKFDLRFQDGFEVDSWERDMLDYFVVQRGRLPVLLTARSG
ncbi:cytochrome P450 [Favolaschia claudopus]|uniref:Cytochrome P450 n=1 Tax=Favolaschia claudopus TaxID=2862362 RepID=A0AAW0C3C2_9AGAR